MARDEFTSSLKLALAKRVAFRCCNPACRSPTAGPHSNNRSTINIGVAAHISAAAAGGPRFDASLTQAVRGDISNAIWLCQSCAKLVDSDSDRYSRNLLTTWKLDAESEALREIAGIMSDQKLLPQPISARHTPIPQIADLSYDEARRRLISVGWQPYRQHWSHGESPYMKYGNGKHFWEKGYHEIVHAYPTGAAFCTFCFVDVYRNKLVVVTAGEVNAEQGRDVCVWNWYFKEDLEDEHRAMPE